MSISCHEAEPMLAYRLDNELDFAQSQEVERHLKQCASCRQALQEATGLRHALRRASVHTPAPSALRGRIRLSVERERRNTVQLSKLFPSAIAGAILACFLWHLQSAQAFGQAAESHAAPGQPRSVTHAANGLQNPQRIFASEPRFDAQTRWRSRAANMQGRSDGGQRDSSFASMQLLHCAAPTRQSVFLVQRADASPAQVSSATAVSERFDLADIH